MGRSIVLLLLLVASLVTGGSCAVTSCSSANCSCESLKVNCASLSYDTFPADLPLDTRQLVLSFNRLTFLSSVSLNVLIDLVYLDCSNNMLREDTLNVGALPLVYLDLSNNNMTRISPSTFGTLSSLAVLKLHNNAIERIEKDSFATNKALRELDLRNASLTYLDVSTVSSLPDLNILHLVGNPWHCNCSLRDFCIWAEFSSAAVQDFDKITCAHSTEDPEESRQHHPVLMVAMIEKLNRICFTNLKQKDYIFLIFIGFTVFCLGTVVAWVAGICIVLRNRLCKSGDDDEDYVEEVVEADTPVTNRHLEKEDDHNFYVNAYV